MLIMTNHKSVSLGVLGRYYSVRHALGQYRSACVTATYHILSEETGLPLSHERLHFNLELSLQATIREHSGLLYGISEESEAGIALYKQVHQIDRGDILKIITSSDVDINGTTEDALLSQVLEEAHDEDWSINKPAWKVIVLEHFPRSSKRLGPNRVDIAFIAHHAIADGLSGVAFHASLADNLQRTSESLYEPTWPMTFCETIAAPIAIEERVDCLSCSCHICKGSESSDHKAWVGTQPQRPNATFRSIIRIVTIPATALLAMLRKCKKAGVKLTGLLHAMICSVLCYCIKEDIPGIRCITPFSVRNYTKASRRDIVNNISYLTSYTSRKELERLREFDPRSAAEEQRVMEIAQSFSSDIAASVGQFPHGSMVTSLNRIEDLLLHYQDQDSTHRRNTYELSNLGSISDILPPEGSNLKLDKLIFTQCATSVTPAIGFNCVSTRGGPLVITITWAEGVIEESLVDHLVRELQNRLGFEDGAN